MKLLPATQFMKCLTKQRKTLYKGLKALLSLCNHPRSYFVQNDQRHVKNNMESHKGVNSLCLIDSRCLLCNMEALKEHKKYCLQGCVHSPNSKYPAGQG